MTTFAKRRRGGQPGNTNALKSGIYSPRVDDAFPPLTPASTRAEVLAAGEFVQARTEALNQAASRCFGRRRKALQERATRLALRFLLQFARATGNNDALDRIPPALREISSENRIND